MSATIHLHRTHRQHTEGRDAVRVEGATIGACLAQLVRTYPAMQPELFDRKGGLKNTIEIYLNMESAYPDELLRPVQDGDDIHITILLAGG